MAQSTYVLGSSPKELSRLSTQARLLQPITERMLRLAGIKEGMRVLDLGSGAGDVSLLVAELVGPTGFVLGIDQSAEAIAKATERIRESGLRQIDLYLGTVDEFHVAELFDMVIGRYVLIHQARPANFIRAAARHVRPGGIVAFHELNCFRNYLSLPTAPLFDRIVELCRKAAMAGFPGYDAAGRMVEYFHAADLPCPEVFAEMPIGTAPDSDVLGWWTETAIALTPVMVKNGWATEEEMTDRLEERLRSDVASKRSQFEGTIQVCAWARI
jgi:SAM-dependent methyltransferase